MSGEARKEETMEVEEIGSREFLLCFKTGVTAACP